MIFPAIPVTRAESVATLLGRLPPYSVLAAPSHVRSAPDDSPVRLTEGVARRRDYLITFATEFAVMLSSFLALKLAAVYWGPSGFGEYVILRRALALMYLPVLCGMSLAVTRYVSIARSGGQGSEATYAGGAALVTLATSLGFMAGAILLRGPMSTLVFGAPDYRDAIAAMSVAVMGLALHGVAYGIARGRFALGRANLLQGLNLALVPLVVFLIPGQSIPRIVGLTGGIWVVVSGAVIARQLLAAPGSSWRGSHLWLHIRQLLGYGLPRVPGEFALGALFMIPVTLAAHRAGVTEAGFLGLGVTVLGMIGAMFAPLGSVLLPAVTTMLIREGQAAVRRHTIRLMLVSVGLAMVVVAGLELLMPWLIREFLGDAFLPAIRVVRIVCLAGVFQVLYVILRNVLDAVETSPLNAKNLTIALAVFLAGGWFGQDAAGIAGAFALSVALLGVLTVLDVARVLRRTPKAGRPT